MVVVVVVVVVVALVNDANDMDAMGKQCCVGRLLLLLSLLLMSDDRYTPLLPSNRRTRKVNDIANSNSLCMSPPTVVPIRPLVNSSRVPDYPVGTIPILQE